MLCLVLVFTLIFLSIQTCYSEVTPSENKDVWTESLSITNVASWGKIGSHSVENGLVVGGTVSLSEERIAGDYSIEFQDSAPIAQQLRGPILNFITRPEDSTPYINIIGFLNLTDFNIINFQYFVEPVDERDGSVIIVNLHYFDIEHWKYNQIKKRSFEIHSPPHGEWVKASFSFNGLNEITMSRRNQSFLASELIWGISFRVDYYYKGIVFKIDELHFESKAESIYDKTIPSLFLIVIVSAVSTVVYFRFLKNRPRFQGADRD